MPGERNRGPGPCLLLRSPLVLAGEPQGPGPRLTLHPFRALPRELWWLHPRSLRASLSLRPLCSLGQDSCPRLSSGGPRSGWPAFH